MFKITKEWLDSNKTKSKSFNRKQLNLIGIKWPPKKNWQSAVIGKEITDSVRVEFERGKAETKDSTIPQVKRVFNKLNKLDKCEFAHWAMSEASK